MRPGRRNLITDVDGIRVGNAVDTKAWSGSTVVVPDERAVAAAEVRGGAPGTRDINALDPSCRVDAIDAIVLSGGSMFGIDAAAGATNVLAATGRGGPEVAAAATDPRRLEHLVRVAYRHAVRYYIDMMRVSAAERLMPRLHVTTPETVDRVLGCPGSLVLVGLHFGALELPTLYLASRGLKAITVPMETLGDPDRKSTRLNSSHVSESRMPSSA